ncbi:PucR family transcriptional regulator [Nocardia asteroides]|uniref:CdaR family transcriptional regulator n=1 Tax=Nocardia asteroides NBRC 15531 TaxID=1110697 RepID=U5E8A9_NOCAS|nr:helix-turn-helix domain-containing protein [Nocardia asteroides]TLF67145.1 PucR family transcriptional regulator [Nocardia asteroides NBRC 15531]UGT51577.1 helix-turn-helix domain-containing protein [Nocardia asteroides]SFM22711.1 transcriptional regulator, CdaR family [Nocardia asteroides]VEG35527.1 carbohydrate diacid transcriptional activator CdaR [Nocardia asteroides]GAD86312.1 putative CdaR family transcriptional regulator [Nocardia asteroides NBRC 15531]
MSVENPPRQSLTISGQPMSSPLKDVRTLSRQMVGHFVANVAPCGTLPGDAISGDVTTITRICLEFAVSMLDGRDIPSKLQRLQDAASGWAREGVPIDTIHHSIAEGFKIGLDLVVANASVKDYDNLVDGVKMVMEMLDTITSQVSLAYVRELRGVVSEHHTAVHTLTSALLGGHSTSTMARECGIAIAETYAVLALAIPPHREEANPALDSQVVARRKLRRVQAELAKRCGDSALSLLSVDGGTVLIPADTFDREGLAALVAQLSQAAQVGITAALVETSTTGVPDAADQAHELLDMVQRLEVTSGLYRFDELALEYQLTRPGPGREFLGSLLDPLDQYPELLETLQRHIANNLNRQRTARVLHVHTNTVDYRLKRIGQLTGFDPTQPSGLWYLRSALVARSYRSAA